MQFSRRPPGSLRLARKSFWCPMESLPQVIEYTCEPSPREGGDIPTCGFTILVFLDTVIAALQSEIDTHEHFVRVEKPPPAYPPDRLKRHAEVMSLKAWLLSEKGSGFPHILWDTLRPDYIRGIASRAVCDRHFTVLHCGLCQRDYAPSEIKVKAWISHLRWGDPYGGREAFCPEGHCLCHGFEWMS